jgi:hypothetical protein
LIAARVARILLAPKERKEEKSFSFMAKQNKNVTEINKEKQKRQTRAQLKEERSRVSREDRKRALLLVLAVGMRCLELPHQLLKPSAI